MLIQEVQHDCIAFHVGEHCATMSSDMHNNEYNHQLVPLIREMEFV
jgi:hypothetical protein